MAENKIANVTTSEPEKTPAEMEAERRNNDRKDPRFYVWSSYKEAVFITVIFDDISMSFKKLTQETNLAIYGKEFASYLRNNNELAQEFLRWSLGVKIEGKEKKDHEYLKIENNDLWIIANSRRLLSRELEIAGAKRCGVIKNVNSEPSANAKAVISARDRFISDAKMISAADREYLDVERSQQKDIEAKADAINSLWKECHSFEISDELYAAQNFRGISAEIYDIKHASDIQKEAYNFAGLFTFPSDLNATMRFVRLEAEKRTGMHFREEDAHRLEVYAIVLKNSQMLDLSIHGKDLMGHLHGIKPEEVDFNILWKAFKEYVENAGEGYVPKTYEKIYNQYYNWPVYMRRNFEETVPKCLRRLKWVLKNGSTNSKFPIYGIEKALANGANYAYAEEGLSKAVEKAIRKYIPEAERFYNCEEKVFSPEEEDETFCKAAMAEMEKHWNAFAHKVENLDAVKVEGIKLPDTYEAMLQLADISIKHSSFYEAVVDKFEAIYASIANKAGDDAVAARKTEIETFNAEIEKHKKVRVFIDTMLEIAFEGLQDYRNSKDDQYETNTDAGLGAALERDPYEFDGIDVDRYVIDGEDW